MNEVLDWLGTRNDDPLDDLIPLRRHLYTVISADLQARALLRLLDLFEPRIARLHALVFPMLLDAQRPLPRNLHVLAQSLADLHGLLTDGLIEVGLQMADTGLQRPRKDQDVLPERAFQSLHRQYELALRYGSGTPASFWGQLNQLVVRHLADDTPKATLKLLLAMHAAQPETLTAKEQAFLWRHTALFAAQVEITTHAPQETSAWLWADGEDGRAPTPSIRRAPPSADGLFFYHCRVLGTHAQNSLNDFSIPQEWRSALHHAARRWLNPPARRHPRQRGSYRIEICPRLSTLWGLLNNDLDAHAASHVISEWQVLNDSPAGYAAMHIAGGIPTLQAGSVIGIRRHDKMPWSLCTVRWTRSDNAEHFEIGLEVLASHAQAVRVAVSSRAAPLPALLLPPISGINRGEALLAEQGIHAAGTLTLLQEESGRLQIVECKPLPIITQTDGIELFEFERGPHAG
ncbi:MAG TPA: hypothetical protein VL550_06300 [Rhodocyclaceae bacterium]|jgi:hypothetical protein|nr:hypothetical protein [Rhodocyclaceae bacterium]